MAVSFDLPSLRQQLDPVIQPGNSVAATLAVSAVASSSSSSSSSSSGSSGPSAALDPAVVAHMQRHLPRLLAASSLSPAASAYAPSSPQPALSQRASLLPATAAYTANLQHHSQQQQAAATWLTQSPLLPMQGAGFSQPASLLGPSALSTPLHHQHHHHQQPLPAASRGFESAHRLSLAAGSLAPMSKGSDAGFQSSMTLQSSNFNNNNSSVHHSNSYTDMLRHHQHSHLAGLTAGSASSMALPGGNFIFYPHNGSDGSGSTRSLSSDNSSNRRGFEGTHRITLHRAQLDAASINRGNHTSMAGTTPHNSLNSAEEWFPFDALAEAAGSSSVVTSQKARQAPLDPLQSRQQSLQQLAQKLQPQPAALLRLRRSISENSLSGLEAEPPVNGVGPRVQIQPQPASAPVHGPASDPAAVPPLDSGPADIAGNSMSCGDTAMSDPARLTEAAGGLLTLAQLQPSASSSSGSSASAAAAPSPVVGAECQTMTRDSPPAAAALQEHDRPSARGADKAPPSTPATAEQKQLQHSQLLAAQLSALMSSPHFADVEFVLRDGRRVLAVAALLAARSPIFAEMLASETRQASPGHRREITLLDVEPALFEQVVRYALCGTCDVQPSQAPDMAQLARRFGFDVLAEACQTGNEDLR